MYLLFGYAKFLTLKNVASYYHKFTSVCMLITRYYSHILIKTDFS